jgi:hypothetical protein
MRHYKTQLKSAIDQVNIASSGGKAYVTAAGGTAKATLYNADGSALANPISMTYGQIEFYTADTVASVDIYVQTPTGHFVVEKAMTPSGNASLFYNNKTLDTTFVIPFNIADTAAATETSTGFTVVGAVQPNPAIDVITVDDSMTIDVGTLSSDSGDADGYVDGVLLTTAGYVPASLIASADTMGALLSVLDSANSGDDAPEQDVTMIGKTITYTLSTSTDTGAGFIVLKQALRPSVAL